MKWHVRVQINSDTYAELKAYFLNIALHRQADYLARAIWTLPYQPYRPVRERLLAILRAVNRARRTAGYQRVPISVIRFRCRPVRTFSVEVPPGDQTLRIADIAIVRQRMYPIDHCRAVDVASVEEVC